MLERYTCIETHNQNLIQFSFICQLFLTRHQIYIEKNLKRMHSVIYSLFKIPLEIDEEKGIKR